MPADLTSLDATTIATKVQCGELTAAEVTTATLATIETVESEVNAFRVVMSEQAQAQAEETDSLSASEREALPMAGVPIAIKDDTDVAGQSTMWGTAIDRGRCEQDAEIVERLRRAGATIIGKTIVPELTLWPWTASKTGGVTRNPWNASIWNATVRLLKGVQDDVASLPDRNSLNVGPDRSLGSDERFRPERSRRHVSASRSARKRSVQSSQPPTLS